jgi:hypothetical protein
VTTPLAQVEKASSLAPIPAQDSAVETSSHTHSHGTGSPIPPDCPPLSNSNTQLDTPEVEIAAPLKTGDINPDPQDTPVALSMDVSRMTSVTSTYGFEREQSEYGFGKLPSETSTTGSETSSRIVMQAPMLRTLEEEGEAAHGVERSLPEYSFPIEESATDENEDSFPDFTSVAVTLDPKSHKSSLTPHRASMYLIWKIHSQSLIFTDSRTF